MLSSSQVLCYLCPSPPCSEPNAVCQRADRYVALPPSACESEIIHQSRTEQQEAGLHERQARVLHILFARLGEGTPHRNFEDTNIMQRQRTRAGNFIRPGKIAPEVPRTQFPMYSEPEFSVMLCLRLHAATRQRGKARTIPESHLEQALRISSQADSHLLVLLVAVHDQLFCSGSLEKGRRHPRGHLRLGHC